MGLGNRSARDKQPVIACPEVHIYLHIYKIMQKIHLQEKRYVCVKMYGGGLYFQSAPIPLDTLFIFLGMGDQIKRYCEKLAPEEYEELLDNEVRN